MFRVARWFVVRADINLSTSDGDVAVTLRTDLGNPAEIFDAVGVDFLGASFEFDLAERSGEIFLRGIHVAYVTTAPFGPVGGRNHRRSCGSETHNGQAKRFRLHHNH